MKDVNGLIENGVDVKKSLELFGDMNTYDTMLEDFLKEVDGKIASAKRYLEMSDMANILGSIAWQICFTITNWQEREVILSMYAKISMHSCSRRKRCSTY